MTTLFTQFDRDNIIRGPGLVWFDVPLPVDYGFVDLDNDGKPTTGGTLAGYTRSGWSWTMGVEQPPEEAWPWQQPLAVVAPISMTISAEIVGLRNLEVVENLLPAMFYGGGLQRTFSVGSPRTPAKTPSILVVFKQVDQRPFPPVTPAPKQYGYVMIYKGLNIEDIGFAITRRDYASARFTIRALPIMTRPPADQYGQFRTFATPEV